MKKLFDRLFLNEDEINVRSFFASHKINVPVYADAYGDSRLMPQYRQTQLSRLKQLTFQSFFVSLFRRLHKISNEEANNKSNSQRYSQPIGHLDEEIARQPDGKNGFGYIGKKFRKELPFGFVKDSHQAKAYHDEKDLSNFINEGEGFNKKGQDEIHPALLVLPTHLMDRHSPPKNNRNIAVLSCNAKSGKRAGKNCFEDLFNVFGDGVYRSFYYKSASKLLSKSQIQQLLSRLPLFISFFDKPNAKNYKTYTKYSKNDSEDQWQVFEKITRETDCKNIFAKVAENFGNKFINFFFISHTRFFLDS